MQLVYPSSHLLHGHHKDGLFRVLIKFQVLPSADISLSQAMGDHSMLTFGGKERTEEDWRTLLESVGLVIEHIYQGSEPEALIECRKA